MVYCELGHGWRWMGCGSQEGSSIQACSRHWRLLLDFRQLQRVQIPPEDVVDGVNYRYIQRDWTDTSVDFQQRCRRRRVVPPSTAPIAEWGIVEYGDGGELRVKRWPTSPDVDLQIQFARILAEAVNTTAAGQGIDGNLGLGVAGWRSPWTLARSKDRTTFFDIINHGPGVVPTPMCVTVRLLPPDGYQLARANKRVQSFLYFGVGSPCGLFLEFLEDHIRIPEYTPRLYIFPDMVEEDEFHWWSLQLLSITLLEPLVDNPNYAGIDALQWMPRHIPLGADLPGGLSTGVRVIFDSACWCSVFPRNIMQAIWTQWFQNDAELYPDQAILLRHFRDFSRHDIVFQFRDSRGTITPFRCRAQEFLSSPWNPPDGYGGSVACLAEAKGNGGHGTEPYILGANFFWTSILRLDGTHRGEKPMLGQAKPFMQLAPQRILSDGLQLAGPWSLEIHPDLPPDMQAVLREQPELQA
ncbi:hypothetical protein OH76DRAFT_778745 [Lentinus brumalis]|uniref:Uncharacterized protein n=1 Tax=Lentinus brumalis TaxID=2498619 RepID=A0A371D4C9_9APHY|nr:hypothetical protein OH76DRAFT_778745 [Polyporus brumalis]